MSPPRARLQEGVTRARSPRAALARPDVEIEEERVRWLTLEIPMRMLIKSLLLTTLLSSLALAGCGSEPDLGQTEDEWQSRGLAVACDGAWFQQESSGRSTWALYIKGDGAGAHAKDLIFKSAERHAYEAAQAGDQRDRDFYWMSPDLRKAENEVLFYVLTPYGADIMSASDYAEGRRLTNAGARPSLFWVDVIPTDGGASLRFVLRTALGTFRTGSGGSASCRQVPASSNDCVVQEYVFRDCHIQ